MAEESGLIIPIGEWVLREACREAASWPQAAAGRGQPLAGAIPARRPAADWSMRSCWKPGSPPAGSSWRSPKACCSSDFIARLSILRRLKALGVRIAMDDFGTGYSSLSYLQAFPFDKIKIDQSFIVEFGHNPQSAAIMRAVVGLGRGLELSIVAEGVETRPARFPAGRGLQRGAGLFWSAGRFRSRNMPG